MSEKKNPLFIPAPEQESEHPERNPVFVPDRNTKSRCCPVCGSLDFIGRKVMGVISWKCTRDECRNEWYGGLPQEPQDPRVPVPPERYTPPISFDVGVTKQTRGQVVEIQRPVDTRPEFKKGALITGEDDG